MKNCPYCGEEIQEKAIVCHYCGRDLVKTVPLHLEGIQSAQKQTAGEGSIISFVVVGGFFFAIGLLVLMLIWSSY